MDFTVEKMKDEDWGDVVSIYQEGIVSGNATFETEVPGWDEWDKSHLRDCRLVARADGEVVGWAALSYISSKPVYSGVVENSVYVRSSAKGAGVGKALLAAIVRESENIGIWTM